jgi:hypothetical protein
VAALIIAPNTFAHLHTITDEQYHKLQTVIENRETYNSGFIEDASLLQLIEGIHPEHTPHELKHKPTPDKTLIEKLNEITVFIKSQIASLILKQAEQLNEGVDEIKDMVKRFENSSKRIKPWEKTTVDSPEFQKAMRMIASEIKSIQDIVQFWYGMADRSIKEIEQKTGFNLHFYEPCSAIQARIYPYQITGENEIWIRAEDSVPIDSTKLKGMIDTLHLPFSGALFCPLTHDYAHALNELFQLQGFDSLQYPTRLDRVCYFVHFRLKSILTNFITHELTPLTLAVQQLIESVESGSSA